MMTGSVQNMRNVRGDGGGLFACGREAVESVKMVKTAFQISVIEAAASQEKRCSTLQPSVSYAEWPTTFVGRGSYRKSRFIVAA
jgi:hypothetical protein